MYVKAGDVASRGRLVIMSDSTRFTPSARRLIWLGCQVVAVLLVVAAMGVMVVVEDKSLGVLAAAVAVATVRFLIIDLAEWARPSGKG